MSVRQGLGMRDVKPQLQAIARELARELVPNGKAKGDIWQAPSPRRSNGAPTSFCIWIGADDRAGGFKDFVTGEAGDVFATIEYCLANVNDPKEALAWAKARLGLDGPMDKARIQRVKAEAKVKAAAAAEADEKEKERKRAFARNVWLGGRELAPGCPAWTYLTEARRIPMQKLYAVRPIGSLRSAKAIKYHWPKLEIGDSAGGEDQAWYRSKRPRSGISIHPGLLATMAPVNGGKNAGLHRTFLADDGRGKAEVPTPKRMMGQLSGCWIPLWRGKSGLSPRKAASKGEKGVTVVCEGIEDGLSIAISDLDLRVCAVGSLAGLTSLPFPDCASELIVFADNDWEGSQAALQLDKAVTRLSRLGPTRVARLPAHHKDPNEVLMQGAQT
jgi:hypothetical protein